MWYSFAGFFPLCLKKKNKNKNGTVVCVREKNHPRPIVVEDRSSIDSPGRIEDGKYTDMTEIRAKLKVLLFICTREIREDKTR